MKKLLVIGAVLGAVVLSVLPASAQLVIRGGEGGIVVRDNSNRYDRDRGYRSNRHSYRSYNNRCRTVTTRRHRPNGSVVVSTRRICR